MTYEITRCLEFDAGHRIYGHESKCAHIHGHRYTVLITCRPNHGLDDIGRVIDFGVIKAKVGTWIDENLDHGMLLYVKDPLCDVWRYFGNHEMKAMVVSNNISNRIFDIDRQKHFIMDNNPTAENIAKLIYQKTYDLLGVAYSGSIRIVRVVVKETPNCSAMYSE